MRNEKREMRNEKWEMRNEKWEMRNEKWEMRNEKWEMITCQYNLLFLFVNNIIMASDINNLLKQLPFYKQAIKKPCIKKLSNQELLRELPYYDDINISKTERTFRGYAGTYNVEIINNKNLSESLSVSKK